MTPNNKQIAKHYGLTQNTISNYKNGSDDKKEVYKALKFYLTHIMSATISK